MWHNLKTQIVAKLEDSNFYHSKNLILTTKKNSNCNKTQFRTELQKSLLVRTSCHLNNWWDVLRAAFWDLAMFDTNRSMTTKPCCWEIKCQSDYKSYDQSISRCTSIMDGRNFVFGVDFLFNQRDSTHFDLLKTFY